MTNPEPEMRCSAAQSAAWRAWLAVAEERVHIGYELTDPDVATHARNALRIARNTAGRILGVAGGRPPRRILDVGCSAGFKAAALASLLPDAEVHGVDVDDLAVVLGGAVLDDLPDALARRVHLTVAEGERLPYADASFDLIVCLTTIEHVRDVEACITEMARVLAPGGRIILEAPNYLWPVEPHLGIIVPPLAPKGVMRLFARLQGRSAVMSYVDHLQLVHPGRLEALFRALGLDWRNVMLEKVAETLSADAGSVIHYRRLGELLRRVGRLGLGRPLLGLLRISRMYPSLNYVVFRRSDTTSEPGAEA